MPYLPTPFRTMAILSLLALSQVAHSAGPVKTLEWTDLMPPEDLQILEAMPEIEHNSPEAPAAPLGSSGALPAPNPAGANSSASPRTWEDVLHSDRVRPEFDKQHVRIAGFIVPIEFDDTQKITEFFLVPYQGACIHVPPPPPNQIIHVKFKTGLKADDIYLPYWVTGTLALRANKNKLAYSAYALEAEAMTLYEGE